jgi:hypothetical protein
MKRQKTWYRTECPFTVISAKAELTSVVKMLTSEFIPLATLLGSHLEEVSIKSQAAESERNTQKVSRNAYAGSLARDGRSQLARQNT